MHVCMRSGVAPAPTGSSTQRFPRASAFFAAFSMASIQRRDSVPMLISVEPQIVTMSSTSSTSWAYG